MKTAALLSFLLLTLSSASAVASRGDTAGLPVESQASRLSPATANANYKVEFVRGMGPVVELAVSCEFTTFYVSYSVVDRSFCDPKLRCSRSLPMVTKRYCNSAALGQ